MFELFDFDEIWIVFQMCIDLVCCGILSGFPLKH